MIVKEFREVVRDRRTLAMLVALPLILLIVFGYAANFYVSHVSTAVVGSNATEFAKSLPAYFDVTTTKPSDTLGDAKDLLRNDTVDVAFVTAFAFAVKSASRLPLAVM